MKKNAADLYIILAQSRLHKDSKTWDQIQECLNDGVNPFITFKDVNGLKYNPLIYTAFRVCTPEIVKRFLNYALETKNKVVLSTHLYETGRNTADTANLTYEWNALQDIAIFRDFATLQALCEYAEKTEQDPAMILNEPILLGQGKQARVNIQELILATLSLQNINTLDHNAYPKREDRIELEERLHKWMTGVDTSAADEFSDENPLKLTSDGRYNVFAYLIDQRYINVREMTSVARPFYDFLNNVAKRANIACELIRAHSAVSMLNVCVVAKNDTKSGHDILTASGLLLNLAAGSKIPVQIGIDLRAVNKLVQDKLKAENAEIERQKQLELARAAAPQSEVRRHSFQLVKDQLAATPVNRRNTFKRRGDISEDVKDSYLTIWKRVHTHIMARELTTTRILNARAVTSDAQIGSMIQTAFDVAISSIPLAGEFASILPKLTGMALEYNTSKKANAQSESVFQATLNVETDAVCTNLAEVVTAMIVKEYGSTPDKSIAEYIAKQVNAAVDKDLNKFVIKSDAELFAFLLAYANKALTDTLTMKQFKTLRGNNSDTTSANTVAAIMDKPYPNKKGGNSSCCNIS